MPGPRTGPSLNHPLTMSYMGTGSGREKGWGAGIFTLPCQGEGRGPKGRGVGLDGGAQQARSESSIARRAIGRQEPTFAGTVLKEFRMHFTVSVT